MGYLTCYKFRLVISYTASTSKPSVLDTRFQDEGVWAKRGNSKKGPAPLQAVSVFWTV